MLLELVFGSNMGTMCEVIEIKQQPAPFVYPVLVCAGNPDLLTHGIDKAGMLCGADNPIQVSA